MKHDVKENKNTVINKTEIIFFKTITRYYFTQGSVNMKIKKIFNVILCCILIVTSLPFCVSAEDLEVIEIEPYTAEYAPGEIVITTSDELIDSSTTFVTYGSDDYTLINFEEEKIESAEALNTYNEASEERTYVIEVEGDVLKKCEELEKMPGVICAEPNIIFHTMDFTMPDEINYGGIYTDHMKWYFNEMKIPKAWQTFESTGEGILIAVIDNGYDITASEFPTNLWTDANGNHGWNTYKNSADISPIYKSDGTAFNNTGHGTHVAGIIGSPANGSNLIGAAYNSELMLINAAHYISDDDVPSFLLNDIIEAVDYARNNGADIINLSLGAFVISNQLEYAVNRAYNAGIAVIAAAGNDGASTAVAQAIPASYENVIGVMASDKTDPSQLAYFSNYDPSGEYYDIAAPGYQILSCSIETGKVAYMSGTSQASPLVAACAALYLSEYPNATVAELYDAIRNSPQDKVKTNSITTPDATYYFNFLTADNLLLYGKTEPEVIFNSGTNVVNDVTLGYIYGLNEDYTDISSYVTVTEGTGTYEFLPSENGNGTGSVLNVYDIYGELYKTYSIIIFGDINGDSVSDGQDAVLVSCVINFPSLFTDEQKYAADVDFDNIISETDNVIIAGYALGIDFVSQIK